MVASPLHDKRIPPSRYDPRITFHGPFRQCADSRLRDRSSRVGRIATHPFAARVTINTVAAVRHKGRSQRQVQEVARGWITVADRDKPLTVSGAQSNQALSDMADLDRMKITVLGVLL